MTLGLLELLSVVGVPLLFGAALLRAQGIGPRTDALAYAGWAWIQGALGIALVLSAWVWLGAPLRAVWLVPAVLAASAGALAWARWTRVPVLAASAPGRAVPRWERWLFAGVLAVALLALVDRILLSTNALLATSDEASIWAAKAKLIFHAGAFDEVFRRGLAPEEFIEHPDYPPLNPLLQVWVFAHAGEILHLENRLPIQLFGPAGLLVAAAALRRRARPGVAALFLACIATLGFTEASMRKVSSDILIATGAFVAWDLWLRFREEGEAAWLRLLATSAVLLVWSKNEGLLHVVAFVLAFALARLLRRERPLGVRPRLLALWCAPLLLSLAYHAWFNAHFGATNDLVRSWTTLEAPSDPEGRGEGVSLERASARVGPILANFWEQAGVGFERTRGLSLLFLVLALLDPARALAARRAVFTLALWLVLGGYLAVYLGSTWDVERHLQHSLHRLVYHLLPAQALWLCSYVVEALPRRLAARPVGGPCGGPLRG